MLYSISGKYSELTKNCCCRQDSEYKMMSRTGLALHSKFDFTGLLFLCSLETSFHIWSKANWICKDIYLILWLHSNHQKILRLTSLTWYASQLIFLRSIIVHTDLHNCQVWSHSAAFQVADAAFTAVCLLSTTVNINVRVWCLCNLLH